MTDERGVTRQEEWGWEIAVYLYLAGMGAGSFAMGVLLDWLGYISDLLMITVFWGPLLAGAGAIFLVMHLGIKKRFMKAARNPSSSWLSRGFFILVAFVLIGVAVLALSLVRAYEWRNWLVPWRVMEGIGLVLAMATAGYTGILLKAVRYVALWNTWLLPLLFVVSALSTGSMALVVSDELLHMAVYQGNGLKLAEILAGTEFIFVSIEVIVIVLYLFSRYRSNDQGAQGKRSVQVLVSGDLKYMFWGGVVGLGILLPVALNIISLFPLKEFLTLLAAVLHLTGGFFLRFVILSAGIKDKPPLWKLTEMRGRWQYTPRQMMS